MTRSPLQRVRAAEAELAAAELSLHNSARPWRKHVQRHRAATIVVGGLASGFALALLPVRWWAGIGAFAGRTLAIVARSALAPALVSAVAARTKHTDDTAASAPD
jgi:hypothetical protein